MKRNILIVLLAIVGIVSSHAQQVTPALTVYKQFKPGHPFPRPERLLLPHQR